MVVSMLVTATCVTTEQQCRVAGCHWHYGNGCLRGRGGGGLVLSWGVG
jgi:hypothetical protein